jgi:hypothetical protein
MTDFHRPNWPDQTDLAATRWDGIKRDYTPDDGMPCVVL